MNAELIRKLAAKAHVDASLELQFSGAATWYIDQGPTPEQVNQKFAELIVRECAQIMNSNDHDESTLGDRLLFEHFGVEP